MATLTGNVIASGLYNTPEGERLVITIDVPCDGVAVALADPKLGRPDTSPREVANLTGRAASVTVEGDTLLQVTAIGIT